MHDNITLTQRYDHFSDDTLDVAVSGKLFLLNEDNPPSDAESDILTIAHALTDGRADFNDLYGAFRIAIVDKTCGKAIFFADNAASRCFYYDDDGHVSDSLLALAKATPTKRTINLKAAAQYLAHGCTITNDTLVQGITKTDPYMYYVLEDGKVTPHDKNLLPLCERYTKRDLYDFVKLMLNGTDSEHVCARLTGGTDSRSVLAALLKAGKRPSLFISGHEGNPDVRISQEIARALGLEVSVLDPSAKADNWLEAGFEFGDGTQEVVGAYRQLVFIKMVAEKGSLLFGGVGGEFYKNSFCKYFFSRLFFGQATPEDALTRILINPIRRALRRKCISHELQSLSDTIASEIQSLLVGRVSREKNNLARFNAAGFKRMQGYTCITNSVAKYLTQIDPLMDRHTIRSVSYMHPLPLSMAVWQRRQVRANWPALSNIHTDQGMTCSLNPIRLNAERIKKGFAWVKRITRSVANRLGISDRSPLADYWKADYVDARSSTYWGGGINICKRLHILDETASDETIPLQLTGYIILFGMLAEYLEKD